MSQPELVLKRLTRQFVGEGRPSSGPAVSALDLEVGKGEFLVIIGPSGCGKSTTLRLIAGLDEADSGEISIAGKSMKGIAPQDRDVAMVFQGYALYPHMTAREIMEFPLKMRGVAPAERAKTVEETAEMLGLTRLLDRRPDQMSGGERQRVAMGRAIVRRPKIFLFDEPLSNLDAALRADIRADIGALVRRLGVTALYVTHDHVEAMTLADRIAVMKSGKLLQLGTPRELYEKPVDTFVAQFLGSPSMNILDGFFDGKKLHCGGLSWDTTSIKETLSLNPDNLPKKLQVGIRPEHVSIEDGVHTEVSIVEPLGAESHITVIWENSLLRARTPGFSRLSKGDRVGVSMNLSSLVLFDPEKNGTRITA